jgi:N-formylglutamate amidohydrolase
MFEYNHPKSGPIFDYYTPENRFIGVLSIPHSGEWIPDEFKPYLLDDHTSLLQDVDFRVNELVDIEKLVDHGIAVQVAKVQRVAIDLNRSPELCVLNWKKNSQGVQIVLEEPTEQEVSEMITKYHTPYFEILTAMINELKRHQKVASFIDLHSMPSKATDYHLKINPNQKVNRPDFCLSDIEGISCEKDFINLVKKELTHLTKNITLNDPYFGGHITRHTHASIPDLNNIQIEINRGIYMDEEKFCLVEEKVAKLRPILTDGLIKTFSEFHQKYKL